MSALPSVFPVRISIFLLMTEIPEWFKITEGDQKPAEFAPKPKKHLFKVAAITTPLLIVGAVVFGATGEAEEDDAPAFNTTLSTSSNSITANTADTNGVAPRLITNNSPTGVGVANPAAAPIGKPGVGVPMPSGEGEREDDDDHGFFGGDDDDDDDHDDDDDEHESRERHHEEGGH